MSVLRRFTHPPNPAQKLTVHYQPIVGDEVEFTLSDRGDQAVIADGGREAIMTLLFTSGRLVITQNALPVHLKNGLKIVAET